ncbi:hypothetical protein OSB04_006652 [Centaurea solstitialis]|uniref:Reverse transcriptase RNase H-like domain-containing protein n=1 Tax=Centaurea solstitialis TaxID=347529 RepID=A0AA38U1J8_9ASTR|nr:hypothetical protein OSB04_006652 [Centaurea solstitialis]
MTVYCDVTYHGLGCVLMQRGKLRTHEANYSTRDLELATLVFASKLWRHYLCGVKCTIYTDRKSLRYFLDQRKLNMEQNQWLDVIKVLPGMLELDPPVIDQTKIPLVLTGVTLECLVTLDV